MEMALAFAETTSASRDQRAVTLLECTLRDGSYAVDYAFTAEETARVAKALESAGVRLIEIGHGLGLGASESGHGIAAASDQDYCAAVDAALTDALWGVFFIPGIGNPERLAQAIDAGLGFVRIGSNITELAGQAPYIAQAKVAGLLTFSNLMKSYVVRPAEFARHAAEAQAMGADIVVLVDSAGGMMPREIAAYVEATLERAPDLRVGFHGHNNLGLANANALAAAEAGAVIVDATLNGLGRSAGNAITESLVLILQQAGFATGIDSLGIQDIGKQFIQPYLQHRGGIDPLDLTVGAARFHSSYLGQLKEVAAEFGLDLRALVLAVGALNLEQPTRAVMREVAGRLSAQAYPIRLEI